MRKGLADQRLGGDQTHVEPVGNFERLDGVARRGRLGLVGPTRGAQRNEPSATPSRSRSSPRTAVRGLLHIVISQKSRYCFSNCG